MRAGAYELLLTAAEKLRLRRAPGFDTTRYWENRYASGGSSGDGSYGQLALFKAQVVNAFLRDHDVRSAIEFGCGDGHQLSLMSYSAYIGLDVSASAVSRCISRFKDDLTKSFFVYNADAYSDALGVMRGDVALSLDVIYHIVSDATFERYMRHLCSAGSRFLIVYSTDFDELETQHVRHRAFTRWMASRSPEFRLLKTVPNPHAGTGPQQSNAGFFLFERTA